MIVVIMARSIIESARSQKRNMVGWRCSFSRKPFLTTPAIDQRRQREFAKMNVKSHIRLYSAGRGDNVIGPPGFQIPNDNDNAIRETVNCARC